MDSEHIAHLTQEKEIHQQRLRKLQLQRARLGANTPPEVQIEVEELEKKISSIDLILKRQYYASRNIQSTGENGDYQDEEDNSIASIPSGTIDIKAIIVMAIVVFAIGSCVANDLSKNKLSDTFSSSAGLGSWRTRGVVSLVADGHETDPSPKSGVQVQAGQNAYIYQIVVDKALKGETYSATAWCKAPIGATCRIFLGGVQEGINQQIIEGNQSITRDGTGKWESMAVTAKLDEDQPLGIFLYAEGQSGSAIYDDVSVRKQ